MIQQCREGLSSKSRISGDDLHACDRIPRASVLELTAMMTTPLFGVTTWLWTSPLQTSSLGILDKVCELGFDFVELAVEEPDLLDALACRSRLRETELSATMSGAFGAQRDLTSENPEHRENAKNYIRKCLQLCNELGIEIFGGPMYSAVGKRRLLPADQRSAEWNRAVEELGILGDLAQSYGVCLAIEPINRFETDLVNTAQDAVRLIDDIGHPNVQVMLDSFHLTLEERDLVDAITCCGSRLVHMQVSENYRGPPGSGQTCWDDLKRGLLSIDYHGAISIESFTPSIGELADAVCFWRFMAPDQDQFARDGLIFLKSLFA
jgi:D-psicose/D-tagatose/L-ribulose 3-epimerase